MRIPLSAFLEHIIKQYNLREKVTHGYVYVKIRRSIYSLSQEGALTKKGLKVNLSPYGYFTFFHTPGLWREITCPISFSLLVDDFGVKYINKANAYHLIAELKEHYVISDDWTGGLYFDITLKGHYGDTIQKRWVDILMQRYEKIPQHAPYPSAPN